MMRHIWRRAVSAFVLLYLLTALVPVRAWAHASLVAAVPEPNSRLAEAPPAISLTFNERLDGGLFYIKVLNSEGMTVTNRDAVMSADHTMIRLELPKLAQGAYLVSYHVISEDGHPVGGSYPLAIGPAAPGSPQQAPAAGTGAGSGAAEHQHGITAVFGVTDAIRLLSRGIYFLTLLAAAGWTLWLQAARRAGVTETMRDADNAALESDNRQRNNDWKVWTVNTIRVHIIALLLFIATHLQDYIGSGGMREVRLLFTATSVGLNWLGSLALAIAGLWLVGRSFWVDAGWAAALLLVKSLTGHSVAASGQPLPIASDFIHLLAAALWVGGMWTLLAKRRIDISGLAALLRTFSKISLGAIGALVLTGALQTLLYVPHLRYLQLTQWGNVLLGKIALVLAVIIVAAFLRRRMRANPERLGGLFKIDIALMTAIVLLVGVLTYLPPRPQNEPFYWHQMGDKLHVTATISPNAPGVDNTFNVTVWLPAAAGEPKQLRLQLLNEDRQELAPINVPVQLTEKSGTDKTYGDLQKFSFSAQGPYLPFAGRWKLVVTVRDQNDDETQAEQSFFIY